MYIYSSAFLSISPPNSLVVFVTLTKVKAVLAWSSCLWFTTNQRPTVTVTSRAKAIWRNCPCLNARKSRIDRRGYPPGMLPR